MNFVTRSGAEAHILQVVPCGQTPDSPLRSLEISPGAGPICIELMIGLGPELILVGLLATPGMLYVSSHSISVFLANKQTNKNPLNIIQFCSPLG